VVLTAEGDGDVCFLPMHVGYQSLNDKGLPRFEEIDLCADSEQGVT